MYHMEWSYCLVGAPDNLLDDDDDWVVSDTRPNDICARYRCSLFQNSKNDVRYADAPFRRDAIARYFTLVIPMGREASRLTSFHDYDAICGSKSRACPKSG